MFYKTVLLGIIFSVLGCSNHSASYGIESNFDTSQNNAVKIFRATEKTKSFYLRINDKFYYKDTLPRSMSASPRSYIGAIKKGYQDSFKIYLKIDNRDTLFFLNVNGIDSLLFGRKINSTGFYILTNLQKEGWLSE
ncbi:MAG: hypothetical protein J5I50_11135 [Chitinophagaceae bacterium]|nr:hypothetical protein [Chitinophagaceae bacterium]